MFNFNATSSGLQAVFDFNFAKAHFQVQFQFQKVADCTSYGVTDKMTAINGSHCLSKYLILRSAGKIISDTDYNQR